MSSRHVLSPNPSARAIDAFCGPHHGYLLETALPPPAAVVPLPPAALLAPPVLLLPLLHAAAARETAPPRRRWRQGALGEFWSWPY